MYCIVPNSEKKATIITALTVINIGTPMIWNKIHPVATGGAAHIIAPTNATINSVT